jgi:hypothetical protein
MRKRLTEKDYQRAGERLGVSPAIVRAFAEVESRGAGFTGDKPTILYERHIFYRSAPVKKRDGWMKTHPQLCHKSPYPKGGYGKLSEQYKKLEQAVALDWRAAHMACSWGTFQELGANYADYGFKDIHEFVEMMHSGVDGQLEIFIRSIEKRGLVKWMKNPSLENCAKIARNYNGPNYAKFGYDKKIWEAYQKYAVGEPWKPSDAEEVIGKPVKLSEPTKQEKTVGDPWPNEAPESPRKPSEPFSVVETIQTTSEKVEKVQTAVSKVSKGSWAVTLSTMAGGWMAGLWGFVSANPEFTIAAVLLILGAVWYLTKSKQRGLIRDGHIIGD